jgi:hypothetical protein
MDSIIQKHTDRCFICGAPRGLEWHHVFGGAMRDKSEKYGLKVRLCHYCHNEPPNGVHQNKDHRLKLQAYVQGKAMEHYGWTVEDFRKEFYKSYV